LEGGHVALADPDAQGCRPLTMQRVRKVGEVATPVPA